MSTTKTIYITYPDQIDPKNEKLTKFIESFVIRLNSLLNRILKDPVKCISKGVDFNSENFQNYLTQADKILFFTHPDFLKNESYMEELKNSCELLDINSIDLLQGNSKIFKLCLAPSKSEIHPPCLESLLSYNMFDWNMFTRRIKTLDFEEKDHNSIIYSKLLDLVFDIRQSFNVIAEDKELGVSKTIFLGQTTIDQFQTREELRRELQQMGYKVLPAINLPNQGAEFKNVVLENLQKASASIQIMGSGYGDLLRGTKYSMNDYQNQVLKEYQEANSENIFRRFIWIPQSLKVNDQRQRMYLKRLHRDDPGEYTEIFETPLETFKTILTIRLEKKLRIADSSYEGLSRIYLITEQTYTNECEQLYSALSLSGLRVRMLNYKEQTGIYARHLQILRETDAVIIFQNDLNSFWLDSKLRDIIKTPGIGRKRPYHKILIVTSSTPDERLLSMIQSKIEVLNIQETNSELILQKLIAE